MRWWIKLIAGLLLVAVLLFAGWKLISGGLNLLGGVDLDAAEPDPMFAENALHPTRPPELDAEETPPDRPTLDDYVPDVETPVDKTAAELIAEAKARANS